MTVASNGKIGMAALNAMTLAELRSLEKKVAKAIVKIEKQEKKKALAAIREKAREMGFTLSELTGANGSSAEKKAAGPKKPRAKVPPKYANPANKSQTWTGRGRHPAWVNDALASGKALDDLLI